MRCACVDIGGTFIKSGMLENGRVTGVRETPTLAHEGGEAVVARAADILKSYPGAVCAGVSTAGEVDVAAGRVVLADNIPGYGGLPVRDMLQKATSLPTMLENDVNAAALGEKAFGAAKDAQDFVMLSYGTGIGGAIVHGGKILRGATGSAGELGGLITHPEAVEAGDVGSGSYERYACTAALVRAARALDDTLCDGRAIFGALQRPEVEAVLDAWVTEVCYGLVGVVHALNPGLVVLGGGVLRQQVLLQKMRERLYPLLKPSFRGVGLRAAALGSEAGLYGVGSIALAAAMEG